MANAVRKICTRIGNGHQYLLGTAKTSSAYGGHRMSEATVKVTAGPATSLDVAGNVTGRVGRAADPFRRPQPPPVRVCRPVENGRPTVAAVKLFDRPVSPLRNLNTAAAGPDVARQSAPDGKCDAPPKGMPSAEQLDLMFDRLNEDLPKMFRQTIDYSMYHPKLVFENNIRGTKTVGLEHFMSTMSLLRLMGHLKYAYVKFDILKITKHPEDGTIKLRWRIKGISGMKVFFKFWKFRLWNLEQVIKENIESWHDGFSVFYLGSDGLIHKLTADKMQPDNDPVIEEKTPLATKLALFLGLSPQLNNLDCLMTCDAEQANGIIKMVIVSLEDVI